jgi:hypothetical protein
MRLRARHTREPLRQPLAQGHRLPGALTVAAAGSKSEEGQEAAASLPGVQDQTRQTEGCRRREGQEEEGR